MKQTIRQELESLRLDGVSQWMVKQQLGYMVKEGITLQPVLENLIGQGYIKVARAVEILHFLERLEYLRGELQGERISYEELAELQSLVPYIDPGDVELLEAAGVPERNTRHIE